MYNLAVSLIARVLGYKDSNGNIFIGDKTKNTILIIKNALGIAIANINGEKGITNYGGLVEPPTIVNSDTYIVTATDFDISVPYTATGAVTITIPQALNIFGQKFSITDDGDNAGTKSITIQDDAGIPNVLDTITVNSETHILKYTGTSWRRRQ